MRRACYVLRFLLADRQEFRDKFYKMYGRVGIMATDEVITDIPEYSVFLPEVYKGTRGLGAITIAPVSTAAQENLLCYRNDSFVDEDVMLREMAQGIFHLAAKELHPQLEFELEDMYEQAIASGKWENTYAEYTKESYFVSFSFFVCLLAIPLLLSQSFSFRFFPFSCALHVCFVFFYFFFPNHFIFCISSISSSVTSNFKMITIVLTIVIILFITSTSTNVNIITTIIIFTIVAVIILILWGRISLVDRASDSQSENVDSNPACSLKQGTLSYLLHFVSRNWLRHWFQPLDLSYTCFDLYIIIIIVVVVIVVVMIIIIIIATIFTNASPIGCIKIRLHFLLLCTFVSPPPPSQGEGVQTFFNVNGYAFPANGNHNNINTRAKLMTYDPRLFFFVQSIFPCANNYIKRCSSRGKHSFYLSR